MCSSTRRGWIRGNEGDQEVRLQVSTTATWTGVSTTEGRRADDQLDMGDLLSHVYLFS